MANLIYRKYQNNVKNSSAFGKTYARVVTLGTVGIEDIASIMQDSCTVKRADILAVLSELGPTMKLLMQSSQRVHLPYLGYFKLGISTTGEADAKNFNINSNLKDVHVIFQAESKKLSSGKRMKELVEGAVLIELPSFAEQAASDSQEGTSSGSEQTGDGDDGNDRP